MPSTRNRVRQIAIAPERAESVAVVLASIKCWLVSGDSEWFPKELHAQHEEPVT